jgi:predicted lactoylglutathione lyase
LPSRHERNELKEESVMFDHVSVHVKDLERSRIFYDGLLGIFGLAREEPRRFDDTWHYRAAGRQDFFCVRAPGPDMSIGSGHICFTAPSETAVEEFFRAGVALGGQPLGSPETYEGVNYTAMVSDLDGNKIEAVFVRQERFPG